MYNVNLEVFQGPLDLLLHLIEKMEIDIYNIPIAKLTESYLEYINASDEFSLENAEEYIVMAATLIHIKSKSLLPVFAEDTQDDIEDDLVQQLIEYKNYKELSEKLEALRQSRAQYLEKESIEIEGEASIKDLRIPSTKLLKAIENILKTFDNDETEGIISYKRELSLESVKKTLVEKFKESKKISFSKLVHSYTMKNEIVLVFISILTMIKDQQLICINDKDEDVSLELIVEEN